MAKNARRPFIETLWNHSTVVETGYTYYADVYYRDEDGNRRPTGQRELQHETKVLKHWGRWQTCRRCKNEGMRDEEWTNSLSGLGTFLLVILPFAAAFAALFYLAG
jgi:hypothetical protein